MLRRYHVLTDEERVALGHWHDASVIIGTCDHWKKYDDDEAQEGDWVYTNNAPSVDSFSRDDPRWPIKCETCDYTFAPDDPYQVFVDQIYRRNDVSEDVSLRRLPEGAMYDAEWMRRDRRPGPDGRNLMVKCPLGREWYIDGRASNCTMPDDNEHRCWVRHGEVPNITVDKNGNTCSAGAGSIIAGDYHGFLRDGEFT